MASSPHIISLKTFSTWYFYASWNTPKAYHYTRGLHIFKADFTLTNCFWMFKTGKFQETSVTS